MNFLRTLTITVLCLAGALLAGCAGPRLVQSDVSSYSSLDTLPQPATYRFEHLPSQQQQAAAFAPIEALAEQALARVGMTRNEANARYAVQLGVEGGTMYPRNWPYAGGPMPYFGWGLGWGGWSGRWGGGLGLGMGWGRDLPPPLYHRRASVLIRDLANQQVVFESSALYEDVWTSDPMIYGVLFEQALRGFPQPQRGDRRESTEVLPPQ